MSWRLLSALAVVGSLGACTEQTLNAPEPTAIQQPASAPQVLQSPSDVGDKAMKSTEVYQQIRSIVGEAKASNAGFCRKVALGHRPCGGPESYLVYSAEGIDEAKLLQLIAQYGSLRQAENVASGMMSTCEVIPEPSIEWVGGYCKAGANGPGDAI